MGKELLSELWTREGLLTRVWMRATYRSITYEALYQ